MNTRPGTRLAVIVSAWFLVVFTGNLVNVSSVGAEELGISTSGDAETSFTRQAVGNRVEQLRQRVDCCQQTAALREDSRPTASIELRKLFTSQRDSWPFEFITHTGHFAIIAGQQSGHPQAVHLSAGSITLDALTRKMGNTSIISRFRDGYLLSYPLIVGPDARLDIAGTNLYLSGSKGAFIINQGDLLIRDASVMTFQQSGTDWNLRQFRPFLLSWAGSRTWIQKSHLSLLGYQGHLSTGITLARHDRQLTEPAAELTVTESRFEQMTIALAATDGRILVKHSAFGQGLLNELDILDSELMLRDSQFEGTTIENSASSTIRVRGDSKVRIQANNIRYARKAAIELENLNKPANVSDNHIQYTEGDGVLIRGINGRDASPVLLSGNTIEDTSRSAIDAEELGPLILAGNTLTKSGDYALSYRNQALADYSSLLLLGNHLEEAGTALIRTGNIASLGLYGTRFTLSQHREQVFAGDSAAYQSGIMRGLVRERCDLVLTRKPQQTKLSAHPGRADQTDSCGGTLMTSRTW